MLHEVLLALSGHPSPLFSHGNDGLSGGTATDEFPLSPSEQALLQSLGRLSELHRKLREHADWLAVQHRSTIARAVAASIRRSHLARFQQKILDVERKILTNDASMVGAYDVVPLAGIANEFDGWHRLMEWYWTVATFMKPAKRAEGDDARSECCGGALIDRLRVEARTGFPEIEEAALQLSRVAEAAWMRQLAGWLIYGNLPAYGAEDFFIQGSRDVDSETQFHMDRVLLPGFVSPATASSILFIGKSLHQAKNHGLRSVGSLGRESVADLDSQLASEHLQYLSKLSLPLNPARLSRAISWLKLSLSKNVLQRLLPLRTTLLLLSTLRQYFLLSKGEFSAALINEAESRLQARWQSMGRLLQQDPVRALQGLSIKDAELGQALAQTWKLLVSSEENDLDESLDFARKHIVLSAPKSSNSRSSASDSTDGVSPQLSSVTFNDLLFPSATVLTMTVDSPLNFFISPRDIETYSAINAYLLAIRRAHLRLTDLWRKTSARRVHPATRRVSHSNAADGQQELGEARIRASKRAAAMRKVWASCSAAVSLLSETAAYFEGEIIKGSWTHFESWVKTPVESEAHAASEEQPRSESDTQTAQRDPETLAAGHRAFLAALTYALLLTDVPYTKELRSLLGNIDNLIALFHRLLEVQQKVDLERDSGTESKLTAEEERKVALELDRARKRADSDLKSVINRLRQLDRERIGSARYLDLVSAETGGFRPWKGGSVDRLLMKLEFGRMAVDNSSSLI